MAKKRKRRVKKRAAPQVEVLLRHVAERLKSTGMERANHQVHELIERWIASCEDNANPDLEVRPGAGVMALGLALVTICELTGESATQTLTIARSLLQHGYFHPPGPHHHCDECGVPIKTAPPKPSQSEPEPELH